MNTACAPHTEAGVSTKRNWPSIIKMEGRWGEVWTQFNAHGSFLEQF